VFAPAHHVHLCPFCGGADGELLSEIGVRLEEIEVEP